MGYAFFFGGLAMLVTSWILIHYDTRLHTRGSHWVNWCKIIGITPVFLVTLVFLFLTIIQFSAANSNWTIYFVLLSLTILISMLVWKRPVEGGLGIILSGPGLLLLMPANSSLSLVTGLSTYAGVFLLSAGFLSRRIV